MKFFRKKVFDEVNLRLPSRSEIPDREEFSFEGSKKDILKNLSEGVPYVYKILKKSIGNNYAWPLLASNLEDMNILGAQIYFAWTVTFENPAIFTYFVEFPNKDFIDKVNLLTYHYCGADKAMLHGATHLRKKNPHDSALFFSNLDHVYYTNLMKEVVEENYNLPPIKKYEKDMNL